MSPGATIALFMGPRLSGYSAIDVEDLTAVDLRSRELAVGHLEAYRTAACLRSLLHEAA